MARPTSCKHSLNIGPVTAEYKSVKDVGYTHSSISSLATFVWRRHCVDLAGISNKFSVAITIQFYFTYTLEGVAAVPRSAAGHTFLVFLRRSVLHMREAGEL